MPRPQKYSDDDISVAIDSLLGAGKEVNPSRVKHLLGGGNIERIKAVIEKKSLGSRNAAADSPDLPSAMMVELRRHNDQGADEIRRLAAKLWQLAYDELSRGQEKESIVLRRRIADLEEELAEADRRLENAKSESPGEGETFTDENKQFTEQCEYLKEALRNAESDVRASEKIIAVLERTQRQDRDEIRSLQKRVEELVTELATIKAKG
ncbi:DNA-binding protein [Tepidicaulis sp. LMO-SS28]|uniref:DNA-binding protein n=1 Tax=Tepidicaulis sp. LMO-SS28 TaxID=3447455 RepID=UPI003EE29BC2